MKKTFTHYYRIFDHTADLGMQICGKDPAELFANAGRALFDAMISLEGREPQDIQRQTLSIEGYDRADLMINWLRELLYLWHGRQVIPIHFKVNAITETLLHADVAACPFLPAQHRVKKEIKAVTYHQIAVGPQDDGRWQARVIFDV